VETIESPNIEHDFDLYYVAPARFLYEDDDFAYVYDECSGYYAYYCYYCDEPLFEDIVPVDQPTLSKTTYTYDGKSHKPTVNVYDWDGVDLVKNIDYTLTYSKGRKNVGKYSVKVKLKGDYQGTKTLYFTINPKGTSLSSVKAGKKIIHFKVEEKNNTSYWLPNSICNKQQIF
jgi:hypothetical protein